MSVHQHRDTGRRIELVERPHPVIDLIPWFRHATEGRVFVIAKQGYPRPLINADAGSPNLDGANVAGYLTEPIIITVPTQDEAPPTIKKLLAERSPLPADCIGDIAQGLRYFTSPGGINERATSYLVELPTQGE